MKVKLSVVHRMSFLGLLSSKGDFTMLKILRELREELSLTEADHKLLKVQPITGTKVRFNEKAVPLKEFEFKEGSIREMFLEEVKTQLKDQEKKKVLELDYLDLYEVLMVEKEKPKLKIVAKPKPKRMKKQ